MKISLFPIKELLQPHRISVTRIIECICVAALIFAYLSHLGYLPLNIEEDEARRALVTQEMILSGDYVTPTINGEAYFNKPPLYNWILAGYFKLFGNYSMFTFRLPAIVAIFIAGLLIYYFTKKYTNHLVAFFTAFGFMTNGRMLIYDSLYGYIDLTFALIIYANLMLIFFFGEKKNYYCLFIFSYIISAFAFLLKGMPAIAFQGITLLIFFVLQKNMKKLFSFQHLAGLLTFLLITGSYYFIYFSQNKFSIALVFNTIYYESAKRTFLEYDIADVIMHFFSYPFEILYLFLPWTIFILVLFKKNTYEIIQPNVFIKYLIWTLLANIIIYWSSVDVYPKYIFMLVPLLYGVLFYSFFTNPALEHSWQRKTISLVICISSVAILALSLSLPFTNLMNTTGYSYLKTTILITGFAFCSYMVLKNKFRLHFFLLSLILFRIGFNWFVIEHRGQRFFQAEEWSKQIAKITEGRQLFILSGADTHNFDGYSFHISTIRHEILRKTDKIIPGAFYIMDESQLNRNGFITDLHFINFPSENSLYLVHYIKK